MTTTPTCNTFALQQKPAPSLFETYFRSAVRALTAQKSYSIIGVGGLATGMACCLLIAIFVRFELSYDRFHEQADSIYRLVSDRTVTGSVEAMSNAPFPAGPELAQSFEEVQNSARLFRATNGAE